jgi:hypothetical protein
MIGGRMAWHEASKSAWPAMLGVLVVAPLASCATSLNEGARNSFGRVVTCASDRVSVVSRPDYKPPSSLEPSSPDEAAGPGGLAYWQQRRHAGRNRPETPDAACEVFEVAGCGQRLLFCCHHPMGRDSTGAQSVRTDAVDCEQRPDDRPKSQGDTAAPAPPPDSGK